MSPFLTAILKHVVYPLSLKFVGWVYSTVILKDVEDDLVLKKDERMALAKAVKNAQTDEDRRLLSIAVSKLNKLSIDRYKQVQSETPNK